VREIVLGMWIEAVKAGERSVEDALREIAAPLDRLDGFERAQLGWSFTRQALVAKPRKTRVRKPRGRPTAWVDANRDLVNLVRREEGLPKSEPDMAEARNLPSVFARVAEIWQDYGIAVKAADVKRAYYQQRPKSR
jgi:hypothetical protein